MYSACVCVCARVHACMHTYAHTIHTYILHTHTHTHTHAHVHTLYTKYIYTYNKVSFLLMVLTCILAIVHVLAVWCSLRIYCIVISHKPSIKYMHVMHIVNPNLWWLLYIM